MKKLLSMISNLQTYYYFKLDLQEGTNNRRQVVNPRHQNRKDNHLQSLELPYNIIVENLNMIDGSSAMKGFDDLWHIGIEKW